MSCISVKRYTEPIQYQNFSFCKLSIVKIFPKATIQTKKTTLQGTFGFQMLLQGKEKSLPQAKTQ